MNYNDFNDGKEILKTTQKKSFLIGIFSISIPAILILFFVIFSIKNNINNENMINSIKSENVKLDSLNNDLKKVTYEEFTGTSTDSTFNDSLFYQMLLANNKIKILDELKPGYLRKDIVIRYYPKQIDGNIVYNLSKLGYLIHERPVNETYQNLKSNIMYYGSSVDSTDIILIGLTLVKSGLPLKRIEAFSENDWRTNSIQIETNRKLIDSINLTVDEIINYNR